MIFILNGLIAVGLISLGACVGFITCALLKTGSRGEKK